MTEKGGWDIPLQQHTHTHKSATCTHNQTDMLTPHNTNRHLLTHTHIYIYIYTRSYAYVYMNNPPYSLTRNHTNIYQCTYMHPTAEEIPTSHLNKK